MRWKGLLRGCTGRDRGGERGVQRGEVGGEGETHGSEVGIRGPTGSGRGVVGVVYQVV